MKRFRIAIDIGASSGRAIVGEKINDQWILNEEYRFANGVKNLEDSLIWDIEYLTREVITAVKLCLTKYKNIESISIDTWGVDYVLLENNKIIHPVYAYRSNRTHKAINEVHKIIPFEKLYEITGCQFQTFNTIYQLYKDKMDGRLKTATDFLMIPEYFLYVLTGAKVHEYTNASTTGLLDLESKTYSREIIESLGLKQSLFGSLHFPGETIGYLDKYLFGIDENIKVKLCTTHDTASAVESMPIKNNSLYLSSGTWSLLGVKLDNKITSSEALETNYSNECGPDYIRFQKNIMGLWILQRVSKQTGMTYRELINEGKKSSFCEIFNVNDSRFLASSDMLNEIKNYLLENGKPLPKDISDYVYCICNSLAVAYKEAIKELEHITKLTYPSICLVGGGARNDLLNSLIEKHTGIKVITGSIEATALGNIISQRRKYEN